MSTGSKNEHGLTHQMEVFAQNVASGMTLSASLRAAYPQTAPSWNPDTVWNRASAMARMPKVLARVRALQKELEDQSLWSRVQSARAMIEVIDRPDRQSDVIAAVKVLNEMHGYNEPIKVEHSGSVTKITRRIIDAEIPK